MRDDGVGIYFAGQMCNCDLEGCWGELKSCHFSGGNGQVAVQMIGTETTCSVMSGYTPTVKAPPPRESRPNLRLNFRMQWSDRIPPGDILVVMGDFNACVGKRETESDVWREVRGRHGLGSCNEAGEEFLEFCAINNFIFMNTGIEKRQVHLATWKHPAIKQPHTINFVQVRKSSDSRVLMAGFTGVLVVGQTSIW